MATHDYVIDNSTGANVRADINNVLQAVLTNNSSSSAPSTTAAYMFWADTTTGILKIRNSANNAWVELLQLDGTLTLEDGSASTPGLAFRDDLDTGIFSSAANTFNVATGGVERMELGTATIFNDGGADVDFRIEGDTDTNLFNLDASADAIGIGKAPNTTGMKMEISRSTTDAFVNASDCVLRLLNTDTSANTNQTSLQFTTSSTGSGADSAIVSQAEDANGNSRLEFWTDTSNGMTEKVSIDSTGDLTVKDGDLVIGTSGHGIDFSATSDVGGMSNELLDDYEEGSWTPTFGSGGGATGLTFVTANTTYIKIGRLCHVKGTITLTGVTGNTTEADGWYIEGLPFNPTNISGSSGSWWQSAGWTAGQRATGIAMAYTSNQIYMGCEYAASQVRSASRQFAVTFETAS